MRENLTEPGARKHAAMILAYWLREGYAPAIRVEQMLTPADGHYASCYVIRSDMVNGRPLPSSRVGGVA